MQELITKNQMINASKRDQKEDIVKSQALQTQINQTDKVNRPNGV